MSMHESNTDSFVTISSETKISTNSDKLNSLKNILDSANQITVPLKLDQVPLNNDSDPVLIRKKPTKPIKYTQEISVKFLKPIENEKPGDILIVQEKDIQSPPLPPKLIRYKPPAPFKPEPLIIREVPPKPPIQLKTEHHFIPGKILPPPPRKVIIEKLPKLPIPPPDIIFERWLDYPERERRVIYQREPTRELAPAPKNVHIIWDTPAVVLNRQFSYLGTSVVHPAQYVAEYGATLVHPSAIPQFVKSFRPPNGERLACESHYRPPIYVGDAYALNLLNQRVHTFNNYYAPTPTYYSSQSTINGSAPPKFENLSNNFFSSGISQTNNASSNFYKTSILFGKNCYC